MRVDVALVDTAPLGVTRLRIWNAREMLAPGKHT